MEYTLEKDATAMSGQQNSRQKRTNRTYPRLPWSMEPALLGEAQQVAKPSSESPRPENMYCIREVD